MPNGHFQLSMIDVTPDSKWPNPGLYRDLDAGSYDDIAERASAPILQTIHERTPAHARTLMEATSDAAEETKFSTMMHEAIFYPSRFVRRHAVDARCPATASDGSRCTRSGRIPYRSHEGELLWFCGRPSHHPSDPESNPIGRECTFCGADPREGCTTDSGKETRPHANRRVEAQAWSTTAHSGNLPASTHDDVQIISKAQAEKIGAMRKTLQNHPSASRLLFEASGLEDVTILFEDERSGVPCVARIDRIALHSLFGIMAVDYKIVENAQPGLEEFGQLIERHRYDMQGQFYRLACESQKIPAPAFAIVGQEKEPPYAASVHLFPESNYDETVADLDGAKDIVRNALSKFERCTTDGEWPAYGETLFMAQVPSDASAGTHD